MIIITRTTKYAASESVRRVAMRRAKGQPRALTPATPTAIFIHSALQLRRRGVVGRKRSANCSP